MKSVPLKDLGSLAATLIVADLVAAKTGQLPNRVQRNRLVFNTVVNKSQPVAPAGK
jgi:hypothetical protein